MKLSKFVSIVFVSASFTVLVGGFVVMGLVSKVFAQDTTTVAVDVPVVTEVAVTDVPDAGSFGDLLMGFRERLEMLTAQTDEQKAALEEKFAARREAQLQRLEALPDDDPRKQELIDKLETKHEELLANIEEKARKLTDRREELTAKVDELQARFETRKALVEEAKATRLETRKEWQQNLSEKRAELQQVRTEAQQAKSEMNGELKTNKDRVRSEYEKTQELIQEKAKARVEVEQKQAELMKEKSDRAAEVAKDKETKDAEMKARETFKNRAEGNTSLSPAAAGAVQGARDYQPTKLLEKIGYMWAGW